MLGRKNYTRDEIDHARTAIDAQLAAYHRLIEATGSAISDPNVASAVEAFEPQFFNNMIMVLDRYFVHRLRVVTGKECNPLNEVELLTESLMNNYGVLRGNNVVKFIPGESVLKLKIGDQVQLTAKQFERLASAFFADIESKFL
jgi:hypothetical protein